MGLQPEPGIMPPTPGHRTADDYRRGGLACALRRSGRSIPSVLRWHPEAQSIESFLASWPDVSLRRLLTEELRSLEYTHIRGETGEKEPGLPSPAAYWQRRKRLWKSIIEDEIGARLPRLWRALLNLPEARLRPIFDAVGLDLLAAALRGMPAEAAASATKGWDPASEQRLRGRISTNPPPHPGADVATGILGCFAELRDRHGAGRGVERLGRVAAATLFRRLPSRVVEQCRQISRSNLPEVLLGSAAPAVAGASAFVGLAEVALRRRVVEALQTTTGPSGAPAVAEPPAEGAGRKAEDRRP